LLKGVAGMEHMLEAVFENGTLRLLEPSAVTLVDGQHPESDGTLRFSRVGLDRDVTQAVLYAGQPFDWNMGSGGSWLFAKFEGEWTEARRVGSWLS
jgi:hypothetical protein